MMNTAGNFAGSFLYQKINNAEYAKNQNDMHGWILLITFYGFGG